MPENNERPKTESIVKVDRYVDNAGRVIEERTLVQGTPTEDFTRFLGHSNVIVHDQRTRQPVGQHPVMFSIDAQTIDEAFGKFDELGDKAAGDLMDQMEEARRKKAGGLVIPGQ